MKGNHLFVLSLTACLLAGCVSQSKYKALEAKASGDIAALRSQTADLEARKAAHERQIAGLNDQLGATEKRATETGAEIVRLKGTYDSLVKDLQGEIAKGQIKVTQIRDKLSVQLVEKILFDSGRAEIKPEGKEVLTKVGNVLLAVKDKQTRTEGYTDSVPIGGALRQQFPTNWELSAVRATTVLRFLEEKAGVDGKNLAAVGYGPFRPVSSNDPPEGKAENRRIEITLTPLDVQEVLKGLK